GFQLRSSVTVTLASELRRHHSTTARPGQNRETRTRPRASDASGAALAPNHRGKHYLPPTLTPRRVCPSASGARAGPVTADPDARKGLRILLPAPLSAQRSRELTGDLLGVSVEGLFRRRCA